MNFPLFIKKPVLSAFRKAIALNLSRFDHRFHYVFVLAHMRSGSTLLSHILAAHPDFAGAGETHVFYKMPDDLNDLVITICHRLRKLGIHADYVVDQINHDGYVTDEVLVSPLVYQPIILIRAPGPTLQSIIAAFGWSEQAALDYYTNRLGSLAKYGRILRERALLVDYDDLVGRTNETLLAVADHLSVSPQFEATYGKLKTTGRFGDRSTNVLAGRIIQTSGHKIEISAPALASGMEAYRRAREQLFAAGVKTPHAKSSAVSV